MRAAPRRGSARRRSGRARRLPVQARAPRGLCRRARPAPGRRRCGPGRPRPACRRRRRDRPLAAPAVRLWRRRRRPGRRLRVARAAIAVAERSPTAAALAWRAGSGGLRFLAAAEGQPAAGHQLEQIRAPDAGDGVELLGAERPGEDGGGPVGLARIEQRDGQDRGGSGGDDGLVGFGGELQALLSRRRWRSSGRRREPRRTRGRTAPRPAPAGGRTGAPPRWRRPAARPRRPDDRPCTRPRRASRRPRGTAGLARSPGRRRARVRRARRPRRSGRGRSPRRRAPRRRPGGRRAARRSACRGSRSPRRAPARLGSALRPRTNARASVASAAASSAGSPMALAASTACWAHAWPAW